MLKVSALQIWEHHIHSFVELCPHPSDKSPNDHALLEGDLKGISVGVKDIIDVKGILTRNGSDACHVAEPAQRLKRVFNRAV